jgi:hypothetical protein
MAYNYTVIWGNIGDDQGKRLDHVTVAEPTQSAIMDAAFECFFADFDEGELSQADKDEYRNNTPYDGYAVLLGHITDAPGVGFY